ncbi:hypothetical protein FQZ97_1130460 [compost metagenome]
MHILKILPLCSAIGITGPSIEVDRKHEQPGYCGADDTHRRRPRPSLVEALTAVVVLLPSSIAPFDESVPELDHCRGGFFTRRLVRRRWRHLGR